MTVIADVDSVLYAGHRVINKRETRVNFQSSHA